MQYNINININFKMNKAPICPAVLFVRFLRFLSRRIYDTSWEGRPRRQPPNENDTNSSPPKIVTRVQQRVSELVVVRVSIPLPAVPGATSAPTTKHL